MKKQGKRTAAVSYGQTRQTKKKEEHAGLNRLLVQLIASAALFLLIFVGGGLIPSDTLDVFGLVGDTLRGESRLLVAVESFGSAVKDGEEWQSAFAELFLPVEEESVSSAYWEVAESYRTLLHPNVTFE